MITVSTSPRGKRRLREVESLVPCHAARDRQDVKPGGSDCPSRSLVAGEHAPITAAYARWCVRLFSACVHAPRPAPGGQERGWGSEEGGVRGRGLCWAPAPPTGPARQAAGGGGGGSGLRDSAGGEELGSGSGRHRHLRGRHQGRAAPRCQPCLPGLRAVCVLRLPAAAPREGCWGRARRGDPAGRGGPGFQPLRVTLHKALLLSRPQFPR